MSKIKKKFTIIQLKIKERPVNKSMKCNEKKNKGK